MQDARRTDSPERSFRSSFSTALQAVQEMGVHLEQLHGIGMWQFGVCLYSEQGLICALCQGDRSIRTPHLQGYLETPTKRSTSGLRTLLDIPRIALFYAKGTAAQSLTYCSKQNPPVIFGTPMAQGNRTDLDHVKEILASGAPMREVAESDFSSYVRYKRGFEGYQRMVQEILPYDPPTVIVHWGIPGSGKTRHVYDNHPIEDIWAWGGGQWFDGYCNHPIALFDDFDGSDIPYRLLLRVLDRYPIRVPVKGDFVAWRPKTIYLTSNIKPTEWYNLEDASALLRRLTTVTHFSLLMQ